jgi:hypothetical protein
VSYPKYILLDGNVTAAYYLPRSTRSANTKNRAQILFDSARSGKRDFFFYLPNFCVAEVFSVFMKYSFGRWNEHVRKKRLLDTRVYNSLVDQFEKDIHNGTFIYHYELARYHVLAINLVAPVDHYFQISRARLNRKAKTTREKANKIKPRVNPMGTFDHLIIAMGIHLAKIHGSENVAIVSSDTRLTDVLAKCKSQIPPNNIRKLKLDQAESLTGIAFSPNSFPHHVNLVNASVANLKALFGDWPLPVGKVPKTFRYLK